MGTKLSKGEFPSGHGANDFECFGPPATKDGIFEGTKIADMGCFTQDGKDSNKMYHACVCKSKKNGDWYAYFEWGRTGSSHPDFQFVECSDESDACQEYESQLHSKNDKRGQWVDIAGMKTLQAKPGKDCYLVRPQAVRATGLPDARKITSNDGAKTSVSAPVKGFKPIKKAKSAAPSIDRETLALMSDLNIGTVNYTKSSLGGSSSLPTQSAIDEARLVLTKAEERILIVGSDENDVIADKEMNDLTRLIYSRIPKVKKVGAPNSEWVLGPNNILRWRQDCDAFESALYSSTMAPQASDPFAGMPLTMSWIDPRSSSASWIVDWAGGATKRAHGFGRLDIKNIWAVRRHGDDDRMITYASSIQNEVRGGEEPLFRAKNRPDVPSSRMPIYNKSKVRLLWHGTRSVNVSSILRKGLMLPQKLVGVSINGALFGPGVYGADDWGKSAGYTSLRGSRWAGGDGGVSNRQAFMFLMDVVLGVPYLAKQGSGFTSAPKGYHSVFGKGGISRMSFGILQNNEWIVYRTEQQCLRYLIEFNA